MSLSSDGRPYLRASSGEYFHRVVCPEGDVTDHVNGDTLDDRRGNLRPATRSENARNAAPRHDNVTGVRGVSRVRGGYRARIKGPSGRVSLGTFPTLEGAREAYARASLEMHGEFSAALRGAGQASP